MLGYDSVCRMLEIAVVATKEASKLIKTCHWTAVETLSSECIAEIFNKEFDNPKLKTEKGTF